MQELQIGYIVTQKTKDAYVGGILVADLRGIPLEFRYTEPIKPTKIQNVLYGKAIDRYIFEEVLIKNLAKEIQSKPTFYIVNYEMFEKLEYIVDTPIIEVLNTNIPPIGDLEDTKRQNDRELLLQSTTNGNPLRIKFCNEDRVKQNEILKNVFEIAKSFNPLEPFGRIEKALQIICLEN